jgi:hypothetical protein
LLILLRFLFWLGICLYIKCAGRKKENGGIMTQERRYYLSVAAQTEADYINYRDALMSKMPNAQKDAGHLQSLQLARLYARMQRARMLRSCPTARRAEIAEKPAFMVRGGIVWTIGRNCLRDKRSPKGWDYEPWSFMTSNPDHKQPTPTLFD